MASRSCQSSFDPYDVSSDDDEYLMPNDVAETRPARSDRAAPLLTTARLNLNSLHEAPPNWGQINRNLNDYDSDPMKICSTSWLPDIADWWRQQDETPSKYPAHSDVSRDILSNIPHVVGEEATASLGQGVIGWRQIEITGETLREEVVVRQFARANNGNLAGAAQELDTTNTENESEMKKHAQDRKLHIMAKIHDVLDMWQGGQILCATQKQSRA